MYRIKSYSSDEQYEDMRQNLADLKLPTNSADGFSMWIGNLHTLNSSTINPVGQWVGLPLDEAELDELLDVIQDDGSEYIVADVNAPEGMSEQLNRLTPQEINEIAWAYSDFDAQQQKVFGYAMSVPDFSSSNYPLETVMQWIEDYLMYVIPESDLAFYIKDWLDIYWTPDDWKQMVINGRDYDGLLLELENRQDGFGNMRFGSDILIYPFDW